MDLSNIYNIQKNYFLRENTLSVSFRKQQLKKLYEAINRYEDAIADALKKDLGKSREESRKNCSRGYRYAEGYRGQQEGSRC